MPEAETAGWTCRNCGAPVSAAYGRVFAPPDCASDREVRTCPRCPKIRTPDGGIRPARSRGATETTRGSSTGYQVGEVAEGKEGVE